VQADPKTDRPARLIGKKMVGARVLQLPGRRAGAVGVILHRLGPPENGNATIARVADDQAASTAYDSIQIIEDPVEQFLGVIRILAGDVARRVDRVHGEHGDNAIPCNLPYANNIWMPRRRTDRPRVVPLGATNLGLIGQYAEVPQDIAFTIEYSARTAWEAIHLLLKRGPAPPPVYQGLTDPKALFALLKVLLGW
jgi:hypothetical protein